MEKKILSVQGGKALQYIFLEKPSVYVPFQGTFPLAQNYQKDIILKRIQENQHLDDIPEEWIRDIIVKGEKMYDIEVTFCDYLTQKGNRKEFSKLKNAEKADLLNEFMSENCISVQFLKIN